MRRSLALAPGACVGAIGVYLINLDRSKDRLETMRRQLDDLGLAFERVPAIDGAARPDLMTDIDTALYRRMHGRGVRPGEVGCFLSHIEVMQRFLASAFDYAVILEDDASLSPSLPGLLDTIAAEAPGRDWDVLKLESRRRGLPLRLRSLTADHDLCVSLFRSTGSAGYIVTRRAAQAYLAQLLPMALPYDHAFDRGWHFGLRFREVRPLVVSGWAGVAAAGSTIVTGDAGVDKVRGFRKLPALAHRTRTETRRVYEGLATWLRYRAPDTGRVTRK
jgi:glycosyl transferase, family 25